MGQLAQSAERNVVRGDRDLGRFDGVALVVGTILTLSLAPGPLATATAAPILLCAAYSGVPVATTRVPGWCGSRAGVHHGRRRRAPGGARGPRGRGRRLLDRSSRGHERPVRALRRGHRLRHARRAGARPQGPPGRAARAAGAGRGRVHAARRSAEPGRRQPVVALRAGRRLAPSARSRQLDRRRGQPAGRQRRL